MIQSWANSRSRRFYEEGKASKFSGMDVEAAEDLLAALDAAESLSDLSPLRSLGLHKLKGDRAGQWAKTVNGPWRICFRFRSETFEKCSILVKIKEGENFNHRSILNISRIEI